MQPKKSWHWRSDALPNSRPSYIALKRKKSVRPGVGVGAAKERIDVVEEGRQTGVGSGTAEKPRGRRPAKPSEKVRLNLADAKAVKQARVKKTAKKDRKGKARAKLLALLLDSSSSESEPEFIIALQVVFIYLYTFNNGDYSVLESEPVTTVLISNS